MFTKHKKALLRSALEVCTLVALLTVAVNFTDFWRSTTRRGFFCDDVTLKYPYRDSTVTTRMLYVIGVYLPICVVSSIELAKFAISNRQMGKTCLTSSPILPPSFVSPLYDLLTKFLFGFAAERLVKEIGKHTVGRLRPHFFAVCQPELADGSTCSDASNSGIYLEAYSCAGGVTAAVTPDMLRSMRLSFPSGHSSLSFYGMTFVLLYLQRYVRSGGFLRPALQLGCMLLAWFVALSRVADYKHHWSDVLAGAALGTFVAVVVHLGVGVKRSTVAVEKQNINRATALTVMQEPSTAVNVKKGAEDLCGVKVMGSEN